jgi:hypothetical protein
MGMSMGSTGNLPVYRWETFYAVGKAHYTIQQTLLFTYALFIVHLQKRLCVTFCFPCFF